MVFHNSLAKLRRGKELVDCLDFEIRKTGREAKHRVSISYDSDAGCDTATVTVEEFSTEPFALILGDAIHNFRAALDFAWSDIEFSLKTERTQYTRFPFSKKREGVERHLKCNLDKGKITAAVAQYVLDTVQPYHEGNGADLLALHNLDIRDKHELLIPHAKLAAVFGVRFKDGNDQEFRTLSWLGVGSRDQFTKLTGHRDVKVIDDGTVALAILFRGSEPFGGADILETLRRLAQRVEEAVRGIPF